MQHPIVNRLLDYGTSMVGYPVRVCMDGYGPAPEHFGIVVAESTEDHDGRYPAVYHVDLGGGAVGQYIDDEITVYNEAWCPLIKIGDKFTDDDRTYEVVQICPEYCWIEREREDGSLDTFEIDYTSLFSCYTRV